METKNPSPEWNPILDFLKEKRFLVYSCFEKGCPTKAYATMPKGITGNGVLSP